MQKPVSVLDNETHKILWDFDIQKVYLVLVKRPDLVMINKKKKKKEKKKKKKKEKKRTCRIVDFTGPGWPLSENQRNRKGRQVLEPCKKTKNAIEYEGDSDTICKWRPDLVIDNKKENLTNNGFCSLGRPLSKIKWKRKER